jgi:hypothetical protein
VPHIYTLWWVKSYQYKPKEFPLPAPLSEFRVRSPHAYTLYTKMKSLEPPIETGISVLWESRYQPLLDMMLVFHLQRDDKRNAFQHPAPTRQFAMEYIKTLKGLSSDDLVAAVLLIKLSSSYQDGIPSPLFKLDHSEGSNDMDDMELDLYTELEKVRWPSQDNDSELL